MAVVSISEAARLVGKSRTTIQKYIKQGKLSKCAGENNTQGIDTSELIRVFGNISNAQTVHTPNAYIVQELTGENSNTVQVLQTENDALKREIELLKELIGEKDKRLLLLEHSEVKKKPWWKF